MKSTATYKFNIDGSDADIEINATAETDKEAVDIINRVLATKLPMIVPNKNLKEC